MQKYLIDEHLGFIDEDHGELAFWDLNLTKLEWVLLALQGGLCAILHTGPVIHSSIGIPLILLMAIGGFCSPISGFFYIAASQYLPFPENALLNPAQIGPFVWLIVVFIRYRRLRLSNLKLIGWVLPWFLWSTALWVSWAIFMPTGDYMKSLAYSVIACQLANAARGQYLKCLLGLSIGATFVSVAYWGSKIGLPIELSTYGGGREGFARMGSVRADAVMLWPPLLIGFGGLVGLLLAFASQSAKMEMPKSVKAMVAVFVLLIVPPIFSTMTHGAYAGLAMMVLVVLAVLVYGKIKGEFVARKWSAIVRLILFLIGCCVIAFGVDAFQIRSQTQALERYYSNVSSSRGAAASRDEVWAYAIRTIQAHPIFGRALAEDKEEIPKEYQKIGYYLAHNVFLDVGRGAGIPGILLCALFFFMPSFRAWQSDRFIEFVPFILVHTAIFIFWMSLSFLYYKTFWAFWMLMAMAVTESCRRGALRDN